MDALTGLGYTATEARNALQGLPTGEGALHTSEDAVLYALRRLSSQ